jgi:hypothetical protein
VALLAVVEGEQERVSGPGGKPRSPDAGQHHRCKPKEISVTTILPVMRIGGDISVEEHVRRRRWLPHLKMDLAIANAVSYQIVPLMEGAILGDHVPIPQSPNATLYCR